MRLISLLFIILIFQNCTNNKQKQLPLKKVEKDQYSFKIFPDRDTILSSSDGIVLLIPKNAFALKNGNPINESIVLNLSSYRNLASILAEGLETRSNDKLLLSEGMFSIEGKTLSGKELIINDQTPIKVSLSQDINDPSMMLFKEDPSKKSNWIAPQKQDGSYIIIPFEVLWEKYTGPNRVSEYQGLKSFYMQECRNSDEKLDLIDYQYSFIATTHFWERYKESGKLRIASHIYDFIPWFSDKNNPSLVKLYTTLDIYQADSIVLDYLKTCLQNLQEDTLLIKTLPKGSTKLDHCKYILRNFPALIKRWEAFYQQRLTTINKDWLPPIDTNTLLNIQNTLNETLTLESNQQKMYQSLANLANASTFNIKSFGRYNLDKFLEQEIENLHDTNLEIITNAPNAATTIVFKNHRLILNPSSKKNKSFKFSGKLPQEKAYIISLADKDGVLWFAQKEIMLGENLSETIELTPLPETEIRERLEQIDQDHNRY